MAPNKYRPNYQELYPDVEISAAVMEVLRKSDRKMKYIEQDLKIDHPIKRKPDENPRSKPAREDSYERLLENNHEFNDGEFSPEQHFFEIAIYKKLEWCLGKLDEQETQLMVYVFYDEKTLREIGKMLGISHVAVQKRLKKLLAKLKKLMLT